MTRAVLFRLSLLVLVLVVVLGAAGCAKKGPEQVIDRMEKRLSGVRDYYGLFELSFNSIHSSQIYEVRQWYKSPNMYRTEVKSNGEDSPDQIFITNGDKVWIVSTDYSEPLLLDLYGDVPVELPDTLFLAGMVGRLLSVPEVHLAETDNRDTVILEFDSPSGLLWSHEQFWIDTRQWLPKMAMMYDREQTLVLKIEVRELIVDRGVNDSLFTVDTPAVSLYELGGLEIETLDLSEAQQRVPFTIHVPQYLPPGFSLRFVSAVDENSLVMNFGRGADTLILYEGPCDHTSPRTIFTRGAETILNWADSGVEYVMMGRVNPEELLQISTSLAVFLEE